MVQALGLERDFKLAATKSVAETFKLDPACIALLSIKTVLDFCLLVSVARHCSYTTLTKTDSTHEIALQLSHSAFLLSKHQRLGQC